MREGRPRRYRLWLFPLLLGIGIFLTSVLRFFDLSMGGTNPYTEIELFAEMPQIDTLTAWLGVLLGLFLLMTVIAAEFGYSKGGRLRALESPWRLFAFLIVAAGAIVEVITHLRFAEIMPDLAHYYHVRGGELADIAAVSSLTVSVDANRFLHFLGISLWVALLCRDLLRERLIGVFWAVVGFAHAGFALFILATLLTDAGYATWMASLLAELAVFPVFYIGLAFQLRRHMYESPASA